MVNASRKMDREDSSSTYAPERALEDIPAIKHAEELFLNSAMAESEEYCLSLDPRKCVKPPRPSVCRLSDCFISGTESGCMLLLDTV